MPSQVAFPGPLVREVTVTVLCRELVSHDREKCAQLWERTLNWGLDTLGHILAWASKMVK